MLKRNHKLNRLITAKNIIARYRISYQTINHYTNLGLLPFIRKQGNVRFYDAIQVRQRLAFIAKLSGDGYSLRLIRKKIAGA